MVVLSAGDYLAVGACLAAGGAHAGVQGARKVLGATRLGAVSGCRNAHRDISRRASPV